MLNTYTSHSFIGCETDFNDADIVIVGAPFDGTTSFRPGTRFAPNQIRIDSYGLETYSPYLELDLEDYKITDIEISEPSLEEIFMHYYDKEVQNEYL